MPERRSDRQSNSPYWLTEQEVLPHVLVPELEVQSDGAGPAIDVGMARGKLLVLTLSIDRVVEREGLVISVRGSPDKCAWELKPLLTFPEKYFCGRYSALLDLTNQAHVYYLRVEWKTRRWGGSSAITMFGFSVFTELSGSQRAERRGTFVNHAGVAGSLTPMNESHPH